MIRTLVLMVGSCTGVVGVSGEASAFGGRLLHRGGTPAACEPACQPAVAPQGYTTRTVTKTIDVPVTKLVPVQRTIIGPDGKPVTITEMKAVTTMEKKTVTSTETVSDSQIILEGQVASAFDKVKKLEEALQLLDSALEKLDEKSTNQDKNDFEKKKERLRDAIKKATKE